MRVTGARCWKTGGSYMGGVVAWSGLRRCLLELKEEIDSAAETG